MSDTTSAMGLGNVFFSVEDVERSLMYYRDMLGLELKFRDGESWVAFDVSGTTIALAPKEGDAHGGATVSFRVADVEEWSQAAAARGCEVGEIEAGRHEKLVRLHDPDGNPIIIYSPTLKDSPSALVLSEVGPGPDSERNLQNVTAVAPATGLLR